MQLKQFYNIATKVSNKKSATTSGDLPDCLTVCSSQEENKRQNSALLTL